MSSNRVLRKDGGSDADPSMSSVLQELKLLNAKMDGMKASFEKQLNAKVDNLHDSLERLVNENRDCLKAELLLREQRKFKITWTWRLVTLWLN